MIKDWKKDGIHGYVKGKYDKVHDLYPKSLIVSRKNNKKFVVFINEDYDSEYAMKEYYFKTKSQALAFAKSYMRKH